VPARQDNTERLVTITEGTGRLVSKEADRTVRTRREVLTVPSSRPPRSAREAGQAVGGSRSPCWPEVKVRLAAA